ncbi:MAG: hypothetical protein ACK5RU_01800 [Hyphomonadaceae bacterium]|jgi:hypothetical protein
MNSLHALMAFLLLCPPALWAVANGYVSDSPNLKLYDEEAIFLAVMLLPVAFRLVQHSVLRRRNLGTTKTTLWGANIVPYLPLSAAAAHLVSLLPWTVSADSNVIVVILALAAFVLLTLDAFPSPVEPGQFGPRWVLSRLTSLPGKFWLSTPILGDMTREVNSNPERGLAYLAANSLMLVVLIVWVFGLEAAILIATFAAPFALLRVTLLTSGKFRG